MSWDNELDQVATAGHVEGQEKCSVFPNDCDSFLHIYQPADLVFLTEFFNFTSGFVSQLWKSEALATTNNSTCLCSHRKRWLAAASAVHRHDAELVVCVRCEVLDFSRRGGHCVLSEEAIGILDTYDVISCPSLQTELCHQGPAVL